MTTSTGTRRTESLRLLEHEVGVMIRRIRRVLWDRARAVHPDLQPASYLLLAYLADQGPHRASALAETLCIDKGSVSRQVQHLLELGLVDRAPDPADGRATLVSASAKAVRRINDVTEDRRQWLDERLGSWEDAELASFAEELGRYNAALDERA
jgi:DNA-binding MarR family transcriptional regulator